MKNIIIYTYILSILAIGIFISNSYIILAILLTSMYVLVEMQKSIPSKVLVLFASLILESIYLLPMGSIILFYTTTFVIMHFIKNTITKEDFIHNFILYLIIGTIYLVINATLYYFVYKHLSVEFTRNVSLLMILLYPLIVALFKYIYMIFHRYA